MSNQVNPKVLDNLIWPYITELSVGNKPFFG